MHMKKYISFCVYTSIIYWISYHMRIICMYMSMSYTVDSETPPREHKRNDHFRFFGLLFMPFQFSPRNRGIQRLRTTFRMANGLVPMSIPTWLGVKQKNGRAGNKDLGNPGISDEKAGNFGEFWEWSLFSSGGCNHPFYSYLEGSPIWWRDGCSWLFRDGSVSFSKLLSLKGPISPRQLHNSRNLPK